MKKRLRIWLYVALAATTLTPTKDALAGNPPLPDSVLTIDHVYRYTYSDFERARQIMEQLRKKKLASQYELDRAEGDLYYNSGYFYQALRFYSRALESRQVQEDAQLYMEQLHRMISCYDSQHNQIKKAQYVKLLLEKAKACGDEAMQSVALFHMGRMLYYEGNKERGYEYMQQAAEQMARTDYKYKYDNLYYDYNTLLIFQEWDKRSEEALRTLDALEKVVTENATDAVEMNGLDQKAHKNLLIHRAIILWQLGRESEADACYKQFIATSEPIDQENYLIITYLFTRGLYDEVIRIDEARQHRLREQGDTVNYFMTSVKKSLGNAYREKGDYKTSSRYYEQLAILRDSIKNREQRSAALELAAVYETNEKELLLHKQATEIRLRTTGLIFVCCIVLLLSALLWRTKRYNRTIRRKNESMVSTIGELLNYKEELYLLKENTRLLREQSHQQRSDERLPLSTAPQTPAGQGDDAAREREGGESFGDQFLFERIEQRIMGDRLFLNPDFSREELIRTVHIPKNKFAQLFRQHGGSNFPKYVNNLRLDYAAKMLREYPDYTIDAIAKSCGMSTVQTFHRLFMEKFGVTPTEFRSGLQHTDK